MLVVNLFAGPGAGKSTTAAGVFSLLKMHDINAELLTEFAKDLTWENRTVALENQYYVWGKQYHRLHRLIDKVDVVVTDSPLMLSCIYGGPNISSHFFTLVNTVSKELESINFFINRKKKYNPAGRNQTEEKAKEKDKQIKQMLGFYNVNYVEVLGNHHGINTITKYVLNTKFKKELKLWIGSDLNQL